MKISSDRIEGCQVALNIEAEPDEMEKALEGTYLRLAKQAVIPGFRKGKAPRSMLERHFGRSALLNDAWDQLVPYLYEQAIKEQEIEVFGQPKVEITQDEPLIFKATVPVRPVVELGDYRAIKVTPDVVELTDDNIDEALERLRRTQIIWEPVDREAGLGDVVALKVKGSIEGNTLLDKESEWYHISAESTSPVPGFAEQIVGMKAGDEKEFSLPLPEDDSNPEVSGKDCLFKVSISEVKEEHLPELNDEFAKSLEQDVETMDQLREKISSSLKTAADADARNKLERQVIEAVSSQATLEFPDALTEMEMDRMIQQQMMVLGGVDLDEFLKLRNLTIAQYRDQLRPSAKIRVANSLILEKVAEEEKMEASDLEVDAEVTRRLDDARENREQMQELLSSPRARESLRDDLISRKTIDFLVETATG